MLLSPLQWCVILIGFFVPISVALDNLMLALILLGSSLLGFKNVVSVIAKHPVARAATLLFVLLFVAMFHGSTPLNQATTTLLKYIDLLFIPIFIFLLSNEKVRRLSRYAFLAAMSVTLILSFLVGLEMIPVMSWMNYPWTEPGNPAIFHSHITQNNMMAFAVFLAALELRESLTTTRRFVWGIFILFGIINMLFMVQGRTGYLILFLLFGWLVWTSLLRRQHNLGKNWGWKEGTVVLLILATFATVSFQFSTRLHDRVSAVIYEYQTWTPGQGESTSTGERLNFYSNTLKIIENNVLFGVGTGGFSAAFAEQIQGKQIKATNNAHNEYLMISVQTGIIGFVLLLYLFYMHWRYAPLLPTSFEQDAARGLLIAYMINCMLNSALMDHSDGLFFAFMTAVLFSNLKTGARHG
jgi:O-antigen ligase